MADLTLSDWRREDALGPWFTALSIPDAPVRRKGLREALQFFERHMPTLDARKGALPLILAMDLSRPAAIVDVNHGETLIASRTSAESQFKLFFTRPGRGAQQSGINPDDRRTVKFRALHRFQALETFTSSTLDSWTPNLAGQKTYSSIRAGSLGVMVAGGNTQLIVPNSGRHLQVVQDNGPRPPNLGRGVHR